MATYSIRYLNKEQALEAVKLNGNRLEYCPHYLRDNDQVVYTAVSNNANALEFASKRLKSKKDLCMIALKKDATTVLHIAKELLTDYDILECIAKAEPWLLSLTTKAIKREIYLVRKENNCNVYDAVVFLQQKEIAKNLQKELEELLSSDVKKVNTKRL